MHMLRTMLLLAIALTAMAMTASTTAAQTLEVIDEATGNHCPSVTATGTDVDGGCLIHINSEGNVELRKHVFGVESHLYSCPHEHAVRIDEDGNGRFLEQQIFSGGGGGGCPHVACETEPNPEKRPWPIASFEGTPQGVVEGAEYITLFPCFENPGGGAESPCEMDVPFQTAENQHRVELGHATEMSAHGVSGFKCELVAHWNTETGGSHDGTSEKEVTVTHLN